MPPATPNAEQTDTTRLLRPQRRMESPETTGWPSESSQQALRELGFPEFELARNWRTVAPLFRARDSRCGIYCLALPNDRYYIGQSVDVVSRFAAHAREREQITGFSFVPTPRRDLDSRETELIHGAERAGLVLTNVMMTSDTIGVRDLDAVIPVAKQRDWLRAPRKLNRDDHGAELIELSASHVERGEDRFERFASLSLAEPASLLLFMYLESCIPYPRATEHAFWSVSCLPSTNRQTAPRLLCVNAGLMELFVVGRHLAADAPDVCWAFVNVASDTLESTYRTPDAFYEAHPYCELNPSSYRDAGGNGFTVYTDDDRAMRLLLEDNAVTNAAARLALRVMRKRSTIYSKYHNPQLADYALELREYAEEEVEKMISRVFAVED